MPRKRLDASDILSPMMLKFVVAWQGDAVAAARAALAANSVSGRFAKTR